ncbi:MAG: LLM class flavin-dependent oxidoreductase [Steroidobacteraceae bacterium]|jgi:alkanesulfonate monooxygenase SsuD/methylene tetrahydromethanopterin reductase-like flavin-dependent oxidoreductase (luciferase family)|nr:LLM class flavin-dependent oxidoreductase [Steroidobacteraceae bacterium]
MLNFGIRFDLRNPAFSEACMADRIAAALEMSAWADRLGARFIVLAEHHGSEDGYLPSPLTMGAAVAARTSEATIRLFLIASFYDPLRLAEDLAVLDLISKGRVDVNLVAGYVPGEFAAFGVPMSERATRMTEVVETLKAAWTGGAFEYRGRTVRIRPTPFRRGGPPLTLGGSSEAAARRAARIGDGFAPGLPSLWDFYRDECLKIGKPDPGPPRRASAEVTILSRDPEGAWEALAPYFLHEANAYGAWEAARGGETLHRQAADAEALRRMGTYRVLTPQDYLEELRAAGRAAFAMLHPMVGGIPPSLAWGHLRLFEHEVLRCFG